MKNRFNLKTTHIIVWLTFTAVFFISGCKPSSKLEDKDEPSTLSKSPSILQKNIDDKLAKQLTDHFWQQGLTALIQVKKEADDLQTKVNDLLAEPNEKTLLASYTQWEAVFLSYQKLAPLTFIDHASLSDTLAKWRFSIAAWPLQPGYLDSYGPYIQSGIVHDIDLPITAEVLRKQHGLTDPEEITLGLYAIEFILKGDKGEAAEKRFIRQIKVPLALAQAGLKTKELPNNRRRQIIKLQNQFLTSDLALLIQQWQTDGLLSTIFLQLTPSDKLAAYHKGLINALAQLQLLLNYEIEMSDDGTKPKNDYLTRFEKNRKQAATKQLAVIESLYFDKIDSEDTNKKISFITVLTEIEQEKLTTKIQDIKKQLNE